MKKICAAAAAMALVLMTSQAWAIFDASIFGGYTTVAMDGPNGELDKAAAQNDVTKFSGGYYVGVDASLPLLMVLSVGPGWNTSPPSRPRSHPRTAERAKQRTPR